jgi:predicted ATPase/DNA-binding winged helix-turn-helix (wHTH) protein
MPMHSTNLSTAAADAPRSGVNSGKFSLDVGPAKVGNRGGPDTETEFTFDRFRLMPAQRLLLESEKPVRIGCRAFDVLQVLLERAGELVSKSELVARVWPHAVVEEGNLKVHVSGLRKVLGDGEAGKRFISAVNGRGYCFVEPVTRHSTSRRKAAAEAQQGPGLPMPLAHRFGMDGTLSRLLGLVAHHRLITLVGPGGVGKSSVAEAAAPKLVDQFPGGVCWIDLSTITDGSQVARAVGAALSRYADDDGLGGLSTRLADRRMLIILDNCEHLIDGVARTIVELLRSVSELQVIATSREPLGVGGEHVHPIQPLKLPHRCCELTADDALRYSAIELFVSRASDTLGEFEFRNEDVGVVIDICRKLDGIPLAIELAATHLDVLGLIGLDSALEDPLQLSRSTRRAIDRRHQSLRATLDWSYHLLTASEQRVLRRVSIFAGPFSLGEALAVASDENDPEFDVLHPIFSLVAKSLIHSDAEGRGNRLRLLETNRAYAVEKLRESGELDAIKRRRASLAGIREGDTRLALQGPSASAA